VGQTWRFVFASTPTAHPDRAWVCKQAEAFIDHLGCDKPIGMMLLRDNDGKLQGGFDQRLADLGVEVNPNSPMSPNMNAYIERWIQTIKVECLNHFIVLGERHLAYLVSQFVDFYNTSRPHQNKGNQPLGLYQPTEAIGPPLKLDDIKCESRLGGLLKSYSRKAA
jgi:putative transposase